MLPAQLYVVSRAPTDRFSGSMRTVQCYVSAKSKAAAVRKAKELDPEFFDPVTDHPKDRGMYKAPSAELVVQGPRYFA